MSERALIAYCGLLLAVSAFSVDITLPFFGAMSSGLAASYESVQATVAVYLLSMGIGQMIFGPLSDRFGRRPAIAAGLGIYLVGALASLVAPTIEWVLAGRVLQGLGGGVGPVLGRAIVRDRFTGQALAQNMAFAMAIFSFGPIFAPLIGVAVAELGGSWRAIFVGMALLAAALLIALIRVPETLVAKRPDATDLAVLSSNARTVLAHPQSRYFLVVVSIAIGAMISMISGIPRIYEHEFGVTGAMFALLFALQGVGIVFGQAINHRMIARIGIVPTAFAASVAIIAIFALIALLFTFGLLGAFGLSALLFLFAMAFPIVLANGTSMVLEPHGRIAGFTSSFFGAITQASGALIGVLAAVATAGRLLPFALVVIVLFGICALALRSWVGRHPRHRRAA